MRGLPRRLFSSAEAQVRVRYPVTRRALPELERHSQPTKTQYSSLSVLTIPVLEDSYAYILVDHHSKDAALIDPSEPELVMKTVERFELRKKKRKKKGNKGF
jgi:hypothetical protein